MRYYVRIMNTIEDDLLTIEEVAERLSISTQTLRRYCRDGKIGFVKFGKSYRFKPEHYESFISRNSHPATSAAAI